MCVIYVIQIFFKHTSKSVWLFNRKLMLYDLFLTKSLLFLFVLLGKLIQEKSKQVVLCLLRVTSECILSCLVVCTRGKDFERCLCVFRRSASLGFTVHENEFQEVKKFCFDVNFTRFSFWCPLVSQYKVIAKGIHYLRENRNTQNHCH